MASCNMETCKKPQPGVAVLESGEESLFFRDLLSRLFGGFSHGLR